MATAYRVTLKYPDGNTMFVGTVHAGVGELLKAAAPALAALSG